MSRLCDDVVYKHSHWLSNKISNLEYTNLHGIRAEDLQTLIFCSFRRESWLILQS